MTDGRMVRVGVVVPSSNRVVEDYCHQAQGPLAAVRFHFARISVTEISPEAASLSQFARAHMLSAFRMLAEAQPDALVWAGTAASWLGFENDRHLCDLIERETGIRATSSLIAVNDRLRALGARKIGLVTPYTAAIEARIVANYAAAGVEVVARERLDLTVNTDYAEVSPDRIGEMVTRASASDADAVAILCTNLRGAAALGSVRTGRDVPVLDSVVETFRWLARDTDARPLPAPL